MTLTLLLLGIAVATATLLLWVARGQARPVASGEELLLALKPVDLEAFRNLTDPAEEAYLRSRLSRSDFRRVQRLRLQAAADYVGRTAHNAAVLLRLAEAARQSPEPDVARTAQELASAAMELRLNSMLALALLYARCLVPEASLRLSRHLAAYERVRQSTLAFSRLRMPRLVSRIEAAL